MLTQIEWWGGLIFVLGAAVYRFVISALEEKESGIDWHRLQMHAFFLLPAAVLVGYFYPLEYRELQYGYLALLIASLLSALVMLYGEFTSDDTDESGEAYSTSTTALGVVVLYSPPLVACGLGVYKVWPIVPQLW